MLELTGVASFFRGASVLYWILALIALFLAVRLPRGRWKKAASVVGVIILFGYVPIAQYVEARQREAFAKEAWAYFKKKCETEAGQKIYKTFTGVKSVLVVKPLPAATEKDLFDQYWYGDPYSDILPLGEQRAAAVSTRLIGSLESRGFKPKTASERMGFDFVEMRQGGGATSQYIRISQPNPKDWPVKTAVEKPVSRFGIAWEDISTPESRKYWVAGSRLRVIDLISNSIVAERVGFLIEPGFGATAGQRRPWLTARAPNTTCPALLTLDYDDRLFIHKVLNPEEGQRYGK